MQFSGTVQIDAPRDRVWSFLMDPNEVGSCGPGVETIEVIDEDHFKAKAQEALATQGPPSPAAAQTAGRAFAVAWAKKATTDDLDALLAEKPQIPRELDAELLIETEKGVGALPNTEQDLRREMRAAFWSAIKDARDVRSSA